jgi:HEAT repeat protein
LTLTLNCNSDTPAAVPPEVNQLLEKIERERRSYDTAWREWRAIEELGEDAAPALISVIQENTNPSIRKGALDVLGRWKYKPAFDIVTECAQSDEVPSVRAWALSTLEEIDHNRAYPIIVELVSDPNSQVRRMTARVLSAYPEKDSCALLKKLLNDSQAIVRAEGGEVLILSRKCPETKAWVEEALAHEEDYVTKITLKGALEHVYGVPTEHAE